MKLTLAALLFAFTATTQAQILPTAYLCSNPDPVLNFAIGLTPEGHPCGLPSLDSYIYSYDCSSTEEKWTETPQGQLAASWLMDGGKDLKVYYRVQIPKDFTKRSQFTAIYNFDFDQAPIDLEGPLVTPATAVCKRKP
jgi:hypothetical protein